MQMPAIDTAFIARRRKFTRAGPVVLGFCLAVVIAFGFWLYLRQPQLINYVEVARQIDSGSLDQLSVELMAVMLPIAMLMCLVLLAGVVLLAWAGLSNERRYLQIIDELSG